MCKQILDIGIVGIKYAFSTALKKIVQLRQLCVFMKYNV